MNARTAGLPEPPLGGSRKGKRLAKWPQADPAFERLGQPALAADEVVYRRYDIGRRLLSRARVLAVVTNRRFGLSETSGWFSRKHKWTEVPIRSVRGVDVGFGPPNWIAVAVSALVLVAGVVLGGLWFLALSITTSPGAWLGTILIVAGIVGIAVFLRRQFLFTISITASSPTFAVGMLRRGVLEEYVAQAHGYSLLLARPGPDVLPFLKQIGAVLAELGHNAEESPGTGREFDPAVATAAGPKVNPGAIRAELEASKHPDLAPQETVHRRYHVARRLLSRADIWAVFTSRRVGLFEEKGWITRSYRWTEIPNRDLIGVDVGYASRHWIIAGFIGLWAVIAGYAAAGQISNAPSGFSLGSDLGPIFWSGLTLAGVGLLLWALRRPFYFSVLAPPNTVAASVASSARMAGSDGGDHRGGPGRDVLAFLMNSGALLQELRQHPEEGPTPGPSAPAPISYSGTAPAPSAPTEIVQTLLRDHHPRLAQFEVLHSVWEVGREFWFGVRVFAVVTNRRVGLLLQRGWLTKSFFWTENTVNSVLGVDFTYRYKRIFLVTFRTAQASYQLTVSAHPFPLISLYTCKPSPTAVSFMQQIGAILLGIQQNADTMPPPQPQPYHVLDRLGYGLYGGTAPAAGTAPNPGPSPAYPIGPAAGLSAAHGAAPLPSSQPPTTPPVPRNRPPGAASARPRRATVGPAPGAGPPRDSRRPGVGIGSDTGPAPRRRRWPTRAVGPRPPNPR
jgi:hypothetical protein